MASYNKVILMGNLTRDPELRYTPGNMAVCKVGLAVNRRFKDGQTGEWREEPTFVDVTIFGRRGETFERYHKKGSSAFVEGELRYDTWDDKNTGQKRSKLYVVAENWEFVSGGREERRSFAAGGGSSGGHDEPAPAGGGYGDYDAGGAAGAGGGNDFLEAEDTPF